MKAPTYTDKQIIDAGMQLLAENKRVTPFAIRNAIGGGNPKRIKKIWEENQHEAIEGQMVREQVDLPTEFEDALQATKLSLDELAKRMYNHAQEIAESRVRETITAARKAKESAEIEVAEAMDTVNSLDEEKQALTTLLEQTKQTLEKDNTELEKSNTILKTQLDVVLTQFRDIKGQSDRNERELKDTHTELTISTTKQEEAEERAKALVIELEISRKAEEEAKKEAAILQGKLQVLQKQVS